MYVLLIYVKKDWRSHHYYFAVRARLSSVADDGLSITGAQLSLNCLLNMDRMVYPGKGADCPHIQCFDLHNFLKICENKPASKMMCPLCHRNIVRPLDLQLDGSVISSVNGCYRQLCLIWACVIRIFV